MARLRRFFFMRTRQHWAKGGIAPGAPGIAPRWTVSAKDAVGTAYSASSQLWYSVSLGILSEVYYPTIDRPQTRDLGFLITDGESFFHEDKRDLEHQVETIAPGALGYRITSTVPGGEYRLVKEVIGDPHQCVLLMDVSVKGEPILVEKLKLYVLWAPHLDVGGSGNFGEIRAVGRNKMLTAHKNGVWSAVTATAPLARCSCGYVGVNDGWTDLSRDFHMDWEYCSAPDGNIALTAEIALPESGRFTLGMSFGENFHDAATKLLQSLDERFEERRERFLTQWNRVCAGMEPLAKQSGDGGRLYHLSNSLLLGHEDKTHQGAMIASLSIPWGHIRGDNDIGGYHLVWTRDMYNSVTGLMAAGHIETGLRAQVYLSCIQREDGGFHQNFWITGEPNWTGVQLDAVAFPILLAWRLREYSGDRRFDPYPMVFKAASYLVRKGPATPQERWEENSGLSPSTLASNIAALVCAAAFARERGESAAADLMEAYADFLECHVEEWTVTQEGTLLDDVKRHYVRLQPMNLDDPYASVDLEGKEIEIRNREPGTRTRFPAKEIVDAGFLELVRYGIRKAGTPLMEDSLRVVDAALKTETLVGPVWKRYNHDGYGQREDGGPFDGWGRGRGWPLLTGERGHYELAAGRDVGPYLRAMEGFQSSSGLLSEQVWDADDIPEAHMYLGRPTGAAMPLMWAHAEYVKLLRSARDGKVFDCLPVVSKRYAEGAPRQRVEVWQFNRRPATVQAGARLVVLAEVSFRLRWTFNDWEESQDTESLGIGDGTAYVELPVGEKQEAPVRFTFYWLDAERWEGEDHAVEVTASGEKR